MEPAPRSYNDTEALADEFDPTAPLGSFANPFDVTRSNKIDNNGRGRGRQEAAVGVDMCRHVCGRVCRDA